MSKALRFIKHKDEFADRINLAANELYQQIRQLDVDSLVMNAYCKGYFKQCHSERLVFSLRCSAAIIYDSAVLTKKPVSELSFVDYGAGLGTLFMLAAKLPFKEVLYNDHWQVWCESAEVICTALNIPIRNFIKGDISDFLNSCNSAGIKPDIIASRNVIEHIYDLGYFYKAIRSFNPQCLVYSTTTANYENPAMRVKHIFYHKKVEKKWHKAQRNKLILEMYPAISPAKLDECIEVTRGRAMEDFTNSVKDFMDEKKLSPVPYLGSNTCDALSGVWAEHLLSRKAHKQIIESCGYSFDFTPGFWDEDYKNPVVNVFAGLAQAITSVFGRSGVISAPFVNIIAK